MIKLIRQAWNGAAVISDLSVLCGGWNSLAGSVCGFIGPNLGEWSVLVSSPAQIKTPAFALKWISGISLYSLVLAHHRLI